MSKSNTTPVKKAVKKAPAKSAAKKAAKKTSNKKVVMKGRYRSAVTGKYVSHEFARKHPKTTFKVTR